MQPGSYVPPKYNSVTAIGNKNTELLAKWSISQTL